MKNDISVDSSSYSSTKDRVVYGGPVLPFAESLFPENIDSGIRGSGEQNGPVSMEKKKRKIVV